MRTTVPGKLHASDIGTQNFYLSHLSTLPYHLPNFFETVEFNSTFRIEYKNDAVA
jgi:hypothetical protein